MAATWQHRRGAGCAPARFCHDADRVILLDRECKLVYASPAVSRLFGFASEELVGRPLAWLVHPSDRDEVLGRLDDLAKTPTGSCTTAMRARTRAGLWQPVEMHAVNVGGDDAPPLVATFRDVSDERSSATQTNEALAPARVDNALEKLSLAIEQTADSVLITDHQGVIEYVNPAFEAMTGYTREQIIGQTPRMLRSGVQTREFYQRLWDTILSGRTFRSIVTNRRQDGTLFDE